MDKLRAAYDEVYVYTMGRPGFILQHVVDSFAVRNRKRLHKADWRCIRLGRTLPACGEAVFRGAGAKGTPGPRTEKTRVAEGKFAGESGQYDGGRCTGSNGRT